MANEIFYCSRCQSRLFGQQFLEGTAYRVHDQISCENCLGEVIAPLSLEEQQEILLQVKALKDSQVMTELPEAPVNEEEFFELDTPDQSSDDFFELDTPEKRAKARPRPGSSRRRPGARGARLARPASRACPARRTLPDYGPDPECRARRTPLR